MKHIIKQEEPVSFTSWKTNANKTPKKTYKTFSRKTSIRKDVKKALMNEQGYICCYCESRLGDEQSHIEHFKPQSLHPEESLNYNNLLCSCQKNLEQGEPRHCGNLKGDWFDKALLISPLDPNCESRFVYTFDGRIKPQDQAAEETIEKLGLNIPKLIALRNKAIEGFLDDREDISDTELEHFVSQYLENFDEGKIIPYWTTIRYLFESNKNAQNLS
ncbi:MAG: retron system putative HNH endonuclease [Cyanobacteriota bacterium ELA615]